MKKLLSCCLLLLPLFVHGQLSRNDSAWIAAHYDKIERLIPMRDGVKLFTSVYLPKDRIEKHPILLMRTPYSCAPYGEQRYTERYSSRRDSFYFKLHYIMVYQDVRGRYMSEGDFEDVRPFIPGKEEFKGKAKQITIDESTDTYDTIDWLVRNAENNNGNAGVFGISYPGFYATMAALSNHPALKAVSPQAPVTDWFIGDDFHHKGVPFILDAFNFYRGFGVPRPKPLQDYPVPPALNYDDSYQFFLQQGTYRELKEKYMGDSIKFWNDVAAHPDYDDWWQARNARSGCYDVKPAMLITGGLFDAEDCWGAWNLYKAIEKQSPNTNCKVVNGPWIHGGWKKTEGDALGNVWFGGNTSDFYCMQIELPFFEYYLRGKGSVDDIAEATVFVSGENRWHEFEQWPPKNVQQQSLFLMPEGKLSMNMPPKDKPHVSNPNSGVDFTPLQEENIRNEKLFFDEYTSDPMKPVPYAEGVLSKRTEEYMCDDQRFAAQRPDVLVYATGVLEENVTVTGPVIADLFVSLSTTDADFVVKLIDVFPDDFKYPDSVKINYPMGGYQMLVRGEIMRGRYRNSFEKPEAFQPFRETEVSWELPDVAHTFLKGHRIMIQIQSTWYPLADRNPQQFIDPYACTSDDLKKCEIKVYREADHPSRILLPVLK
jgi:hypothetical protein